MSMNRTIISAILISAAVVTSSCGEKWYPSTGAKVDLTLSIVSSSPATKTAIEQADGHTYARWNSGDKLCVFMDSWKDGETPLYQMTNSSESTDKGIFEGVAKDVPDGSHLLFAFSTKQDYQAKAERKILFNVPQDQTPGVNTFDPAADIVTNMGNEKKYNGHYIVINSDQSSASISDMRFHRILGTVMVGVSVNESSTKYQYLTGEKVKKITLESKAQGIALTGSILWDFDAQSTSTVSANPKVVATLSSPIKIGSEDKAYILTAPVTLPNASTLVATIETEHYRIVKTVTLPQDIPFPANKISSLSLSLKDADTTVENL